jgi:catechol 2,3-dioxygenase-like lactoylglutathione lyase family enzyme
MPRKEIMMSTPPVPRAAFPGLIVRDADAAIRFCRNAFGVELMERVAEPDGRVTLGNFSLSLSEEASEWGWLFSHVFGGLYGPDPARIRKL